MIAGENLLIPDWPDALQEVDIVKACFVMDFVSSCTVRPADFVRLGGLLRTPGRQLLDPDDELAVRQWETLFQPAPSADPVARRRFQKPAPALVMTMPVMQETFIDKREKLEYEVMFIGAGVSLIPLFLGQLIHFGTLGLVPGGGHFQVAEVHSEINGQPEKPAWQRDDPLDSITCAVQPLNWLIGRERIPDRLRLSYETPVRLMVNGRPLRKPRFRQIFPFMLRRVTSMLFAHAGVEFLEEPSSLFDSVSQVNEAETRLAWSDWRKIAGQQGLVVGGFTGEMVLTGQAISDIYWVLAVASLFGIGKNATYGAGRFNLCH
jgi:hypothetical protein